MRYGGEERRREEKAERRLKGREERRREEEAKRRLKEWGEGKKKRGKKIAEERREED